MRAIDGHYLTQDAYYQVMYVQVSIQLCFPDRAPLPAYARSGVSPATSILDDQLNYQFTPNYPHCAGLCLLAVLGHFVLVNTAKGCVQRLAWGSVLLT